MKKSHFTMTELLVVITIVCLLAGFLLPALSSGINRAKLAGCGSNLRQIGQCVQFYCADNNGVIPNIIPGMEANSIPVIRLPNNMVLALGRLMTAYIYFRLSGFAGIHPRRCGKSMAKCPHGLDSISLPGREQQLFQTPQCSRKFN